MDPLPRAEPGVAVATLWDARRDVVLKASKGKKFTLRQLTESVEFFEAITCLRSGQAPGPYGVFPKPVLRENLKRWDGWYAEYGRGLRVDDEGEIVGAPACP